MTIEPWQNPDIGTNLKNFSAAATDLGLGDQLRQQTQDQVADMKKAARLAGGNTADMALALSPAVQALGLGLPIG